MNSKTRDLFVKGAFILAFVGLINKVVGALYRIVLYNSLSATGMTYYEMAYPIYSFLLVISTAGLPTAISKIVSEQLALNDYRSAHRTFKVAYRALFIIGFVTMVIMFVVAPYYANAFNLPDGVYSLYALAPSLFLVSIISAYRGYFQGMQIMTPTAVSQFIEQLGKFSIGLALVFYLNPMGLHFGAAGALIGVTLSELAALIILMVTFGFKKKTIKENMRTHPYVKREKRRKILGKIILIAFPITVGASIMPLAGMIDSYIAMNFLPHAGYTIEGAQQLYGVYAGSITSIVNMPVIFSLSIGMSLVPSIAYALARKNYNEARYTGKIGIKLAVLYGLPCAIGLNILAGPIIELLYPSMSAYEMGIATGLMEIMAFSVLFLVLVQIMTSIIQAYGKYMVPVFNLVIGCIINISISFYLVRMPEFNIAGVAIGTLCCYVVAGLIDFFYVLMLSKTKFSFSEYLIKPIIANGFMGLFIYLLFPVLKNVTTSSNVALLLTIPAGAVVYLLMMIVVKAVGPKDLKHFPGGSRISNLMYKLKIWRRAND